MQLQKRRAEKHLISIPASKDAQGKVLAPASTVIESQRSYLIVFETFKDDVYTAVQPYAEDGAAKICDSYGQQEKINPKNKVDGYQTNVTTKITNKLELKTAHHLRYVCLVSVIASKS